MFKVGIVVILLLYILCSPLGAQDEVKLSEEDKMLLFTSVEYDGNTATNTTFKKWVQVIENHYRYLKVEHSPVILLHKPNMLGSINGKYELKLYKILSQNSESQSRFVLWYKDISSEVWLRVGGYVVNDLHLLFNYLRDDNVTKRQLKEVMQSWQTQNSLFAEVDWECLLRGYKKNNAKSECFRSAHYVLSNDLCINCKPLNDEQLNSDFSRLPLYGGFK